MAAVAREVDEAFISYMLEIDSRYKSMSKSDQSKIEKWVSICRLRQVY